MYLHNVFHRSATRIQFYTNTRNPPRYLCNRAHIRDQSEHIRRILVEINILELCYKMTIFVNLYKRKQLFLYKHLTKKYFKNMEKNKHFLYCKNKFKKGGPFITVAENPAF